MSFRDFSTFLRSLVVGVDTKVALENGKYVTAINFDNAATTPPFYSVMKEITNFAPWYSSVHRGKGHKSILTTDLYEQARQIVKDFVKANSRDVVIFTKSTTESINMLAYALAGKEKQVVLSTEMEHLANDLPWREHFQIDYIKVDEYGRLSIDDIQNKLTYYNGKVKLVAVTGASNVSGYRNPIYTIARLSHQYGAKILVDGAQLIPHAPFDMKLAKSPEHIDYLAFSAHKMYAPFGTGILIGPPETFKNAAPVYKGGGAVGLVSREKTIWDEVPAKYEAGTPNIMGVLALITAIRTLTKIDLEKVHQYETGLINYTIRGLEQIPGIILHGYCTETDPRVSLVSFTMDGIYHGQLAEILANEAGIAVRNGLFCAHPYAMKLLNCSDEKVAYYQAHEEALIPGLIRISFGLYNTYREIDIFLETLLRVAKNKTLYKDKYKHSLRTERCSSAKPSLYC